MTFGLVDINSLGNNSGTCKKSSFLKKSNLNNRNSVKVVRNSHLAFLIYLDIMKTMLNSLTFMLNLHTEPMCVSLMFFLQSMITKYVGKKGERRKKKRKKKRVCFFLLLMRVMVIKLRETRRRRRCELLRRIKRN